MEALTRRQEQALNAVAAFWRQGRPPTTGELLEALQLGNANSLGDLLRPLAHKGFITVAGGVRGRQRLIELTPRGRAQTGFGIPVLGEIPAGPVAEAIQDCEEWLDGVQLLFKTRIGDVALRVKGDSMIGDGIFPDDRVLLRPNIEWRPDEIVAAQIHDKSTGIVSGTLKHLNVIDGGKTVRLRSSNPDYADMEFDARSVTIAGVYRGLVRVIE